MRWRAAWLVGLLLWGAALAEAADTGPLLTWVDNATDETGYEIERAPFGGAFAPVGTTGASATTFRDTTAQPGVRYCWRVRAVNTAGSSGPSNEVCARPVIPSETQIKP